MRTKLNPEQIEALRRLDTCVVSNAIETFGTRLLNEGFCDASIRCLFPDLAPMVGYAVPVKVHCSAPAMDGQHYRDRTDWWDYILTIPAPRVVVIQDTDPKRGLGSLLGEVHSSILLALDCVGAVTNGAVRDLPGLRSNGFQCFAGNVAVSHSYSHITNIGEPVEIAGLKINPGDLLHGDQHGVVSIPIDIAAQIPAVANRIIEKERRLVALCRAGEFSLEKLRATVAQVKQP